MQEQQDLTSAQEDIEASELFLEDEEVLVAGQWRLMWWRFKKHRIAMVGAILVIAFYLTAVFADMIAISDPRESDVQQAYMPPQTIHWFDNGGFSPHVKNVIGSRDPESYKKVYAIESDVNIPVRFFVRGYEYKLFGVIPLDRHLIGTATGENERAAPYFLGTDILGRDQWSRIIFGTRVSLTLGLAGVGLSLFLGVFLGGISGYYGGWVDTVVQRLIEITRSVPTIPLWISLAAAVPRDWSVTKIYFAITIILALFIWTDLGRVVRGRFLALREEDFVTAARLAGARDLRVIYRHMLPNFVSHIITATTLAIPVMIISETALSFLGLGLRAPAVSWGVLLQEAQNVQTVAVYPWLTFPAVPVTIAVLAFNFMGDGMRDAADPYSN